MRPIAGQKSKPDFKAAAKNTKLFIPPFKVPSDKMSAGAAHADNGSEEIKLSGNSVPKINSINRVNSAEILGALKEGKNL